MRNQAVFLMSLFLLLASCSSDEHKLCQCVQKGENLNKLSQEALNTSVVSKEQQVKIETLRKEMHKLCDEFKMMPTAELQQKKLGCKSLEIDAK
jgi:hypothetical protein